VNSRFLLGIAHKRDEYWNMGWFSVTEEEASSMPRQKSSPLPRQLTKTKTAIEKRQ